MEQTRSWFNRFQPRGDRLKNNESKKNESSKDLLKTPREGSDMDASDELPSSITRQKVAAAKQYIENHYKSQMKNLQERKQRYIYFFITSSFHLLKFSSFFFLGTYLKHSQLNE